MKLTLELAKEKALDKVNKEHLLDEKVILTAKVLSAREAIGNPEEYDFPLLKGKEKIIEANFKGHLGHAYTDMYGGHEGSLREVFEMELSNNYRRALQVATINALANYWGLVKDTVHCKNEEPRKCAKQSVKFIEEHYCKINKITFIGYQPALIDAFSRKFVLKIFDLDKDNIGKKRFGHVILNGNENLDNAVKWAELVLATGSMIVNNTIDKILTEHSIDKVIFYGVTIAGVAELLNLKRICFSGKH